MIAKMLIQEIKRLSMKASRQELEQSYFVALESLTTYELSIIRDSYLQEQIDYMMMPELDNLY